MTVIVPVVAAPGHDASADTKSTLMVQASPRATVELWTAPQTNVSVELLTPVDCGYIVIGVGRVVASEELIDMYRAQLGGSIGQHGAGG